MENDDRPTDKPPTSTPPAPLFSILGWKAGLHLAPALDGNIQVASINLIFGIEQLTFLLGTLKTVANAFPGSLAVADRAATYAWHQACYVTAPFGTDTGNASIVRPPCVGIGVASQTASPQHKTTEFNFVFRSDLERIGIRLVFAPDALNAKEVDRVGCGLLHQAMLLYPNLPAFHPLPEGVSALTRHLAQKPDTS